MWNICLNSFRPWIRVLIWVTGYWHYPGKTRFNPPWSSKYDIYGAERKFQCSVSLKKNAIFFMSTSCSFNLLYSWTSNLVSICFCYVYLNISVFTICFCYINIVYHVLCYIHARHHVLPWAKLEALNKKMHLNLKVSIFLIKTLSFD